MNINKKDSNGLHQGVWIFSVKGINSIFINNKKNTVYVYCYFKDGICEGESIKLDDIEGSIKKYIIKNKQGLLYI